MTRGLRLVVVMTLAVSGVWLAAPGAQAHVRESMAYSRVGAEGRTVHWTLQLEYDALARVVDLGPGALAAPDDDARAAILASAARPAAPDEPTTDAGATDAGATDNRVTNASATGPSATGPVRLGSYVGERVRVSLDGTGCLQRLAGTGVSRREGTPYAVLDLLFECPGSTGAFRLVYHVLAESDGVVENHANVVDYDLGGHRGQQMLDWAAPELTVGETSTVAATARSAGMGVTHILGGADHVLFVLALLLGATGRRQLVGVLSTFTLAHSLTLVAAALGWVTVPASVVEPLIALSIVFVAAENLLGASRHRYPVVFGFGLLHGLGFAGSLSVDGAVSGDMLAALFGFNVGIEAGQALLALVAVPLLFIARRALLGAAALRGGTALVAVVGLVWFVERSLLT